MIDFQDSCLGLKTERKQTRREKVREKSDETSCKVTGYTSNRVKLDVNIYNLLELLYTIQRLLVYFLEYTRF